MEQRKFLSKKSAPNLHKDKDVAVELVLLSHLYRQSKACKHLLV